MLDTEKFIKCVKNNPTIWKKNSKGYGDRVMRENCWNIIGQQMFESWDEKTEEERHEEVINMKNKWRHMRDSYNKYINQGKGRFGGLKKRRYIYADNLSFLLQRGSRTVREAQDEETKDITHNQIEDLSSSPQIRVRKMSTKLLEKNNVNKQQLIKNPTQLEEDPDRCYLLSLLPEFKRLNDDEKLDFRFHTLQFFRVIRSKRIRRRRVVTDWEEDMECDMNGFCTVTHPPVSAASTCLSPKGSPNVSGPNSPRESVNSNHSNSSYPRNSPHFETVKTEVI